MNRALAILSLLLIAVVIHAQDENEKQISKHDLLIKISPLSLLNPYFPCIETGASFFLEPNLAIQLKVGHKLDAFNWDDEFNTSGLKLALEYQYFIGRRMYLSIENGVIGNSYTGSMIYLESESSITEIEDTYKADEEIMFGMIKTGIALFLSQRWIIDFYGGFGIKYHRKTIEGLEFDEALGHIDPAFYEWGFGPEYKEFDGFSPRVTLGLNINFRF